MRRVTRIVVRRRQGPMPVLLTLLSSVVSGPRGVAQEVPISTLPTVDRVLADTPTLVYSVGRAGGEHWEMFYRIGDMSFDRSDNLYVLDGGNNRVVQFDAQGRFVRTFGRDGHGPGEFTGPQHLVVSSVGEVVVNDAGRTLIAFKDGEYSRSASYRDIEGLSTGIGAGADGGVCWLSEAYPFGNDSASASVWCHNLDNGGVPTVVTRVSIDPLREISVGDMVVRRRPVYGSAPRFGMLPNGRIVFHYGIDYRLTVLDRHGRVEQEIRREIDARTVTSQDREAWLKEQEALALPPFWWVAGHARRPSG
ncbi:MAG: 6-bladed beta-propeller [Gemmatimonadetes bacterium]|nr:6-bladed beta-propeller [Gemmatimonadota bacterium]